MPKELNKSQKMVCLLGRMAEAGGITAEQAIEEFDLDDRTCAATFRTFDPSLYRSEMKAGHPVGF